MGRPKQDQTMETVSVRLPKVMIEEIDNFVEDIKGDMPLLNISRADGVRQLLSNALKAQSPSNRKKIRSKN